MFAVRVLVLLCSTLLRTKVLSYFRTKVLSKVRKYFRTFVLRTKVRRYFRKYEYFRTFVARAYEGCVSISEVRKNFHNCT